MKRCPQCNRVETDEALKFCRVDGATLISDSGSVSDDAGTAKFVPAAVSSEIETSILPNPSTTPEIDRNTGPTTVLQAHGLGTKRDLRKPKRLTVAAPRLCL